MGAIIVGLSGCQPDTQSTGPQAGPSSAAARAIHKVRRPAVAGLFYPGEKEELARRVDQYLAEAETVSGESLRGLICPHAGYEYSGRVAAAGYKQAAGRAFDTVIVMAPSHYARFRGASIPEVDAYETPLGLVRLSPRADRLAQVAPFVRNPPCTVRPPGWAQGKRGEASGEDTPHTWEHSLEVQIPFLQKTLSDFTLVPIVFGEVEPEQVARALVDSIDDRTLVVASSDLSHFFPYDEARKLDEASIEAVCGMDFESLETDRPPGEEPCGKMPVLALMHLARIKGWQPKLLESCNSGDATGDKSQVVGYAAIAFYGPDARQAALETRAITDHEGRVLLDLAAGALREAAAGKRPSVDDARLPDALRQKRACFVTLTKGGELRGCIGSIFPQEPLCRAVIAKARSAATEDPRFPPVAPGEVDEIDVEVSVLTVPRRLEYDSPDDLPGKLRPHIDGVVLRVGTKQATYLPQVWEKLPQAEAFLRQLAQKAGLPPDGWKDPEAVVLTYQVQAFPRP